MQKDELKKALEEMVRDPNLPINQTGTPPGGLIVKKSRCCNAPVILTGEGITIEGCSQCKKEYHDTIFCG